MLEPGFERLLIGTEVRFVEDPVDFASWLMNGAFGLLMICPYPWFSITTTKTWSRCGIPLGTGPSWANPALAKTAANSPKTAAFFSI